ncbi:MAG: O-antigen ligase family protein [Planctomycetota bacterium]
MSGFSRTAGVFWPVLLLVGATVLVDPYWLDAELARRMIAMTILGAAVLLRPSAFALRPDGDRVFLLLIGWLALSSIWHSDHANLADAGLRLGWWTSLLLVARLGMAADHAAIARTAAWLLGLVAVVGLLQRFGIETYFGSIDEPVSLLGNRNTAAEFAAIAAAAVASRRGACPRLSTAALTLGACYIVANGSRSGLVALPLGVLFVACLQKAPRPLRLAPVWPVALGCLVGWMLAALPGTANGTSAPGASFSLPGQSTRMATLEVRVEIAHSGLHMLAADPILGHGAGQFAVEYPRFRSQREIELSSLSRTEMRRVSTAHDDWLETAIEGGVPALVLLVLFALARLRGQKDKALLAPLLVLFALMLVRSPLQNAPAVLLALLATGASTSASEEATRRHLWLRLLGVCLLLLGVLGTASQFALSRYIGSRVDQPFGEDALLERAVAIAAWDPVAWHLLAQERHAHATDLAAAERALAAVDRAVALRPFEPSYLLLRADVLRACGRLDDSKRQLAEVTKLDPGEPQVQVQLAGIYYTEGNLEGTIIALCSDPPPVLRAQLAARLDEFANLARGSGAIESEKRLLAEAAFVRTLDALASTGARADAIAVAHFDTMKQSFVLAGLRDRDARELLLLAVQSLRQGDSASATMAGELAQKKGLPLPAWQWTLLREIAAPLRALPAWQPLLPRDAG